jgi:hypothetical protein
MNRQEYIYLLSEQGQLQRMLAEIPEEDILDRMSVEGRLLSIETELAATPAVFLREPARVCLTFRGRPVLGTHGIFAEFGASVITRFSDAVATIAASLSSQLAATGPIPNREQNQLLITSTALGSFGFVLEEYQSDQLPLVEGATTLELALEHTQTLLQGTLGTDDDLADSVAGTDPRALGALRAFLDTLAAAEAVCSIEHRDKVVRFSDCGQVRRSLERLSQDNLREEEQWLEGEILGVLPKSRSFEFRLSETQEVIKGKVGGAIPDADVLNTTVHQRTSIKVMTTCVGNGRPRYVLLEQQKPVETAE